MDKKHRLVIVGGGFAGVALVKALYRVPIEITLIDKRNHHLFQPLLYQVATGGLSPANIATPLRELFRKQANCRTVMGEVKEVDVEKKIVHLNGEELPFDSLVVAAGATNSYFGNDAWAELAIGLKSIEDATEIRARVLSAFEKAELATDEAEIRRHLTFVVVGGGPTGVEMAGAICELSRFTLKGDFRTIDATKARILLVEGSERILAAFAPSSSARALKSLQKMGVEVWTKSRVKEIHADHLVVDHLGVLETIATENVIWAAGVKGSPLGVKIAQMTGVAADKGGRVPVQPDLSVFNHPNIFVIGDLAAIPMADGKSFVPGLAPAAMQQGKFLAALLRDRIAGRKLNAVFDYKNKGIMATIGKAAAVVEVPFPNVKFGGFIAWLAWLFIHIMYIIQFQNRLLIMLQWSWGYLTRNKSALLITHPRNGDMKVPTVAP